MHVFTHRTPGGRATLTLVLPFERRRQARQRAMASTGEEIGIVLERGTVLRDGDLLASSDGVVLQVIAAAELLCEANTDDALLLARVAWHLGNRHALVEIGPGCLRFARDAVLAGMVAGLGCTVRDVSAPFHPEPGAYAGNGHTHAAAARAAGIIHDFARPAG